MARPAGLALRWRGAGIGLGQRPVNFEGWRVLAAEGLGPGSSGALAPARTGGQGRSTGGSCPTQREAAETGISTTS